jgi:hypothetical protein
MQIQLESTVMFKHAFQLKLSNQRREAQSSPIPTPSSGEDASTSLESRISYLTETLLMKQALLETVAADKTALSLKVEKLEVSQINQT